MRIEQRAATVPCTAAVCRGRDRLPAASKGQVECEPTCDAEAMTSEAGTARALAANLCAWIDRLFPDADRGERLSERSGSGSATTLAR
jgi:hypothetical protein